MKNLFFTLALALFATSTVAARERVVELPPVAANNTTSIEIERVRLTDTATVVDIKAFFRPGNWIRIDKDTYLMADGKKYTVRSAKGIVLGAEHWMPKSGESSFTINFEPLPRDTKRFDFIETDCANCFKLWGVELSGRGLPALALDPQFASHKLDYSKPLPTPIMKAGTVRLSGRVLDYHTGMNPYKIQIYSVGDQEPRYVELKTAADGSFNTEFEVPMTMRVYGVQEQGSTPFLLIVSPGETLTLNINSREIARATSRLHKDDPKLGEAIYFDGAYAPILSEMAQTPLSRYGKPVYDVDYDAILGMNLAQYQDYVVKMMSTIKAAIAADKSTSEAFKEVASGSCDATTLDLLSSADMRLSQAYRLAHNITDWQDTLAGYIRPAKPDKEFFAPLKSLDIDRINHLIFGSISSDIHYYIYDVMKVCATKDVDDVITRHHGVVSDMMSLAPVFAKISNYEPLSAVQIDSLGSSIHNPFFVDLVSAKNQAAIKQIAANKLKTGYTVVDVSTVAPDSVLQFIIDRHPGKVIFIDFWATWCGPCRGAMKEAEPVKEQFKGKDVVFVYLTSSSPLGAWKNMIIDIPGEHYFLSREQDKYMATTEYQYNGIPSYAIIGRDGTKKHFQTGFMGQDKMRQLIDKEL
ncbi:MAG: TlpA disulfide reductase family protein [Mucinivorans sp.]